MATQNINPLILIDIHHSGYFGWGVWVDADAPERWTAQTIERLMRTKKYKMGLNLGGQTYEQNPRLALRIRQWMQMFPDRAFISGGDYAQLTACVRTGESNIRQIVVGMEEIEKNLGVRPVLWTMSEPGNFAQLPQVLKDYGYDGAILKIHGPGQDGSLTTSTDAGSVWWKGPDGTEILAAPEYDDDRLTPRDSVPFSMWMMTRYRNEKAARGNFTLDDLWAWKETMAAKGIDPVVMSKDDDHNDQIGNCNLCMTSGDRLAEDVEHDDRFQWASDRDLIGMLPDPAATYEPDVNLFETRARCFCDYGVHGNRDWCADLETERHLVMADFASALAAQTGSTAVNVDREMAAAWKSHLAAQNHDLSLTGLRLVMFHLQYESGRMANAVRDRCLDAFLKRVDTSKGDAGAIVVFNPLAFDRKEYATVSLPADLARQVVLCDDNGPCPWEEVSHEAELVTMGFVADVPALGYRRYLVRKRNDESVAASDAVTVDGLTVKAPEYTVTFRTEGGIASLIPAGDDRSVLGPEGASVLGDIGGKSCRATGTVRIESVPLSTVATETGRLGAYHAYTLTCRMTPGVPYIMVSLRVLGDFSEGDEGAPGGAGNPERDLEFSARLADHLQPTTCMREQPMLIAPYDTAMSPIFAAPWWVDYAGNDAGFALFNRGAIGQRWDEENGEVNMILGRGSVCDFRAEFAFAPHCGNWRQAAVHRLGHGYGIPLHAVFEPPHSGNLGPAYSLGRIEPDNVTVSSVFRRGGATYIRVWEHAGEPASVRLVRGKRSVELHRVSLELEDIDGGTEVKPRQIATFRLT